MRAKIAYSTDDRHPVTDGLPREIARYLWDRPATEAFVGRTTGGDRRRFLVVRVRGVGTLGFEACVR